MNSFHATVLKTCGNYFAVTCYYKEGNLGTMNWTCPLSPFIVSTYSRRHQNATQLNRAFLAQYKQQLSSQRKQESFAMTLLVHLTSLFKNKYFSGEVCHSNPVLYARAANAISATWIEGLSLPDVSLCLADSNYYRTDTKAQVLWVFFLSLASSWHRVYSFLVDSCNSDRHSRSQCNSTTL